MNKPATHIGSCQLCNNRVAVTDRRTSHHCYLTQWGGLRLLKGPCPGSNQPPYEDSNALIHGQILLMETRVKEIEVKARMTEMDLLNVWVHEYVPQRKVKGHKLEAHFTWRQLPVGDLLEIGGTTRWIGLNGLEKSCHVYAVTERANDPVDADAYVRGLNHIRAADYRRDNLTIRKYMTWLHCRKEKWLQTPLSPAP